MIEKINSRRGKSKSYYKLLSYIYERKHETSINMKGRKEKESKETDSHFLASTTATSDTWTFTVVGVSLSTLLAVVVGSTPSRARHSVPLQWAIAYVLWGRQDTPLALQLHVEIVLRHALRYGATAAAATAHCAQPAQTVVDAPLHGGEGDCQSCGEQ